MATRPSPRSDAEIRERYRRGLRRSARAQEIAQDLEDGDGIDPIALGRWNRGQSQRSITRANAAVAARGFSAAEADRGRAMQAVNEALQARPDSSLPPAGKAMFERMQSRLPGKAEEFLRDADEYSGRRAGNYNIGGSKPSAAPAEPEPEATGRISVSRPKKTYLDELAGTEGTIETETFNAADMARKYQEQQFDRAELLDKLGQAGRARGAEVEANRLKNQLRERGISPDAAYTSVEKTYLDELAGTEGTPTGFNADKARGMLAQATFQAWDDDKRFTREAKRRERESRIMLSNLRSYQEYMGPRMGTDEAAKLTDRIVKLENDIALGQTDRESLSSPGYWRKKVESEYNNAARDSQAAKNIEDAATARTQTIRDLTSKFDVSVDRILSMLEDGVLSPEELGSLTPRT